MSDHSPAAMRPHCSMMPGFVASSIPPEETLRLVMVMQALRRLKLPWYSKEGKFIADLGAKHPRSLSPRQIEHVDRLAWRYRLRLPTGIAPAADPDATPHTK